MWNDVARESARFASGVLSGLGPSGTPVSVRCRPLADERRRGLVIEDPYPVSPGPASLLYHRHDERLWKLRSCLITGELSVEADHWILRPTRFVPGMGVGGLLSYFRLLVNGRRTASRYLAVRNLARPRPAWDEVMALLDRAAGPAGEGGGR